MKSYNKQEGDWTMDDTGRKVAALEARADGHDREFKELRQDIKKLETKMDDICKLLGGAIVSGIVAFAVQMAVYMSNM